MFLTNLTLTAEPQPDYWRVGAPLVWCDPTYGRLEVPAGFRTDLASIPRVFRNLTWFDPNGPSRRPAVVHDYLYSSRRGYRLGKEFADNFLRDSIVVEQGSKAAAQMFYLAVRVGGRSHWDPMSARTY